MDRRHFCQSTLYAGLAASYPFISACNRVPTSDNVTTSIAGISLDGAEIELEKAAIKELGEAMTGPVILSGNPEYDSVRTLWNAMHDRRPALIARCANSNDVSQAVTFASERGLLTAVRGGGHSFPGKSVCDGGIMIDLSLMRGVEVDVENRRATTGGGDLLNSLDAEALKHGLVTTAGVVSHTGVGGLTLGGGFGRLNRTFGLTIDNLLSAEMVTADGQIRNVSVDENADLFWAIRGGGGNFGAVTKFEFQLHPFERNVFGGGVIWPVEQAKEVLSFYADWYPDQSDELYVGPVMTTTPDGDAIVMLDVCYCGDPANGEKQAEALRKIGKPMQDGLGLVDYFTLQTMNDGTFGHGRRDYVKSGMIKEFTPELVNSMIESFRTDPRHFLGSHTVGGAVARVDELATAFPHRNTVNMLVLGGIWEDPAQDQEVIANTREWWSHIQPHTGGYYTNLNDDADAIAAGNYGPAYARLSEIKGRYDPSNQFRLNSNIEPAA